MENFLIPQYKELKSQTAFCVDSFSQYTSTMYCLLRHNSSYSESLRTISYSINKRTDINSNGLFKFLSQCVMEIAKNGGDYGQEGQHKTTSATLNLVRTPETLYRTFKNELKLDIDRIERIKTEHNNIMEELRQTQKELWKLNKNKETEQIKEEQDERKTAYMELIKKEEDTRTELKQVMRERETRTELKQATENIRIKISEKLLKTLKESLERLRCIVAVFVPHERSTKLLEQIGQIDIAGVVQDIYKSCCETYSCASPKEYFNSMNFDQYLLEKPQTHGPKQLKVNLEFEIVDNDAAYVNQQNKTKWSLRRLFKNKYETKSLEKDKVTRKSTEQ